MAVFKACAVCGGTFQAKGPSLTCSAKCHHDREISQRREHYAANKDRLNESRRAYDAANKDRIREYRRKHNHAYRAANKDRLKEYQRVYRAANKDRLKEYQRVYDAANKDQIRKTRRAYYAANRDRILEDKREYHVTNKDWILESKREYHAANRDWRLECLREYTGRPSVKASKRQKSRNSQLAYEILKLKGMTPDHLPTRGSRLSYSYRLLKLYPGFLPEEETPPNNQTEAHVQTDPNNREDSE